MPRWGQLPPADSALPPHAAARSAKTPGLSAARPAGTRARRSASGTPCKAVSLSLVRDLPAHWGITPASGVHCGEQMKSWTGWQEHRERANYPTKRPFCYQKENKKSAAGVTRWSTGVTQGLVISFRPRPEATSPSPLQESPCAFPIPSVPARRSLPPAKSCLDQPENAKWLLTSQAKMLKG